MNESMLVNEIIRAIYPHCFIMRDPCGLHFTPSGQKIYIGPKGRADLSGNRRIDGRAVYIEVKKPETVNNTTPEQEKFIAERRAEGALADVCCSVQEALNLVIKGDKHGT